MIRYRHRDNPDHRHPAKDWVGLFFLQDISTTSPADTANDRKPQNRAPSSSCEHLPYATTTAAQEKLTSKPSRYATDQTNASTPQPPAQPMSTSTTTIAKGVGVKQGSRESGTARAQGASELEHEICVGSEDNDAKRGTSRKHNASIDYSEQRAPINFEGATRTTAQQCGDSKHPKEPGVTTKTESGSGNGTLARETMVGWRTLPPENEVTREKKKKKGQWGWRVR